MCVERFHISKIVLLTCRTWLINHSSRTLYTVFQPSNPELSKFILCKAYMDDCVLECRQSTGVLLEPHYILLEICCMRFYSEGPSPPRPSQEEPGSPQTNPG